MNLRRRPVFAPAELMPPTAFPAQAATAWHRMPTMPITSGSLSAPPSIARTMPRAIASATRTSPAAWSAATALEAHRPNRPDGESSASRSGDRRPVGASAAVAAVEACADSGERTVTVMAAGLLRQGVSDA